MPEPSLPHSRLTEIVGALCRRPYLAGLKLG